MPESLDALKKKIAACPPDQQAALRDYLNVLLGFGAAGGVSSVAAAKDESDARDLLDIVCRAMQDRRLDAANPTTLAKVHQYPAFRRKVKELSPWFDSIGQRKNERMAFLRVAVNLLVDDLNKKKLTVSSRNVMNHIHRLPSVIHQAFPGYAQAGLLHMIIRKEGL